MDLRLISSPHRKTGSVGGVWGHLGVVKHHHFWGVITELAHRTGKVSLNLVFIATILAFW